MSPILSTISAFGIYYFSKSNKLLLGIVLGVYLILFVNYFYKFQTNYNDLTKSAWQFEYKEIFEKQKVDVLRMNMPSHISSHYITINLTQIISFLHEF